VSAPSDGLGSVSERPETEAAVFRRIARLLSELPPDAARFNTSARALGVPHAMWTRVYNRIDSWIPSGHAAAYTSVTESREAGVLALLFLACEAESEYLGSSPDGQEVDNG
jgi:hypothetical protein